MVADSDAQIAATNWSDTETWIWKRTLLGEEADLNAAKGKLDPATRKGWTKERTVSAGFLRTILLESPYREEIPTVGLRLFGAILREPFKLDFGQIGSELWLNYCRFEHTVDFSFLRVNGNLDFEGSVFVDASSDSWSLNLYAVEVRGDVNLAKTVAAGSLWISNAVIDRSLFLDQGRFGSVDLSGSRVRGMVRAHEATFEGRFKANNIDVAGNVAFWGSRRKFTSFENDVEIARGSIAGDLNFENIHVKGGLYIVLQNVGRNLYVTGLDRKRSRIGKLYLRGSRIGSEAELRHLSVKGDCFFADVKIEQGIYLSGRYSRVVMAGARTGSSVVFDKCTAKWVDLSGATVGGVYSHPEVKFGEGITLLNSQVSGQVVLNNLKSGGVIDMSGITISKDLFIRGGSVELHDLDLSTASIGGNVEITDAKFSGSVAMGAAVIAKSLELRSTFSGDVNLYRLNVAGDLYLSGDFKGNVDLSSSRIGCLLNLSGGTFARLNLSQSRIEGELRLCMDEVLSFSTTWTEQLPPDAMTWVDQETPWQLDLRNARAHTLQDWAEWEEATKCWASAWPATLKLEGFSFERFGGFGGDKSTVMLARPSSWYVEWLERNQPYSPQPYADLAGAFRRHGYAAEAEDILYAGRERARSQAAATGHRMRWLGLTAVKWAIGYGIGLRYFRALIWTTALVTFGALLLVVTDPAIPTLQGIGPKIAFSADQLLPIVALDTSFDNVALQGLERYYFYLHKIAGFLLGSFLAAGLAGLTQK